MRVRNLVLGTLLLALAGCGTPEKDQVASAGGNPSSTAATEEQSEQDAILKYSQCMRENGVPDFPDPKISDNGEAQMSLPEGADREAIEAADKKCKKHMPNGGQPRELDPEEIAKQREYSRCMRENGVSKFPDPNADGSIAIQGGPGLDPMSDEYKAAEEKCRQYLPNGGPGGGTNSGGGQ